jgi:hypothetical protein
MQLKIEVQYQCKLQKYTIIKTNYKHIRITIRITVKNKYKNSHD